MRLQLEAALVVLDAPAAPTEHFPRILKSTFPCLPRPVDLRAHRNLRLVPCVAPCKLVVAIESCFCLQSKAHGHRQMLAATMGTSSSMAIEWNSAAGGSAGVL